MAKLVPEETFAPLCQGAGLILERAMAIVTDEASADPMAALGLALQAMTKASEAQISPRGQLAALSICAATILAQSSESHAELWATFRKSMQVVYDDVVRTTSPMGSC